MRGGPRTLKPSGPEGPEELSPRPSRQKAELCVGTLGGGQGVAWCGHCVHAATNESANMIGGNESSVNSTTRR